MRPLPVAAGRQFGVFTSAQAHAAGWSRSALRHAVASGSLLALRPGLFTTTPEPSDTPWDEARTVHRLRAVAAVLANPRSLASHCSAAVLTGLPVLELPPQPCITVRRRHSTSVPGVHLHRSRIDPGEPGRIAAIGITMPARTVVDIAREHGEAAGVVVADAVLARSLVTEAQLRAAVSAAAHRPGVPAARAAVRFADPRSESVLESLSRLRMRDAALPIPSLQSQLWHDGRHLARVDFYWDEFGVVGEADGWEKYDRDWARFRDEKRRQAALEQAGLIVVRWDSDEVTAFGPVAQRLRAAFALGARRIEADRRWQARPSPLWLPATG